MELENYLYDAEKLSDVDIFVCGISQFDRLR